MAISSFKKLNKAFTTLHSTISTKEEISLTKKEKAITLNKNREGKEGQIAGEDYDWQLQANDWDEVEWSVQAGQGACLQSGRGGPWAECRADTPASWFEMDQIKRFD